MSKYSFVDGLSNFWGISFDKALIKIGKIIAKEPEYYLKQWDPINAVKKRVIDNKRYNIEETLELPIKDVNIKSFISGIPRIIIKDNKAKGKFIRFSSAFFHQLFGESQPNFAKVLKDKQIIKLIFSYKKLEDFLSLYQTSKTSKFYKQLHINGFLNFYMIKMNDITGIYYADEGFKRDMIDKNVFYLYIDKREKLGNQSKIIR